MEFDFCIEFKQGNVNVAAESDLMDRIKLSWQQDIHLHQMIQELQANAGSHRHYNWQQGVPQRKGRLVIGKNDNLWEDILLWIHLQLLLVIQEEMLLWRGRKLSFIGK